ncbi:hypothetical protein CBS101457_001015 [Exobasidium rhododendri]|nr:hypothetical protein CBS101457_001015 [Exobasidium rhododendri]
MAAEEALTPFGNALAGALGGVFSNAVIYPLDTVKTRLQADSSPGPANTDGKAVASSEKKGAKVIVHKNDGLLAGVLTIARSKEGITGLYRGFGASMVNTFSTQFAYFYWYTVVRTLYVKRLTARGAVTTAGAIQLNTAIELLLGALAGGIAQIFTIPVSVIATRQQLGGGSSAAVDTSDPDSFVGVAREIMKSDGITGFWRGLKPSLVLTVNPAITYGVYERVKNIILAASVDGKMTPWKSFMVGAVSKTLATVVTFPYILSKVRLQAKDTKYKGAFDVLSTIAKEKGLSGWYQGMQAQITKAVLAQALLFYFRGE